MESAGVPRSPPTCRPDLRALPARLHHWPCYLQRLIRFMYLKSVSVAGSGVYGDSTQWLAWTAATCLLVVFTRLASLRGEALLSNPSATLWQHARIVALLAGILAQAAALAAAALGDASARWVGRTAAGLPGRPPCAAARPPADWQHASLPSLLPAPLLSLPCLLAACSHALLYLYDAAFLAIDASFSLALYGLHAADHALRLRADARGEVRRPPDAVHPRRVPAAPRLQHQSGGRRMRACA